MSALRSSMIKSFRGIHRKLPLTTSWVTQSLKDPRSSNFRRFCSMSAQQPPWSVPVQQSEEPVLRVYNSLTKSKNEFVPRNGRRVKWYNCGPTVYDASHMGHARNYVTQDILRRIMSDYFNYDVHFVMNITDIDDKIIERARQNHLFETFKSQTTKLDETLLFRVTDAWKAYLRDRVNKGLTEAEKIIEGSEDKGWKYVLESYQNPTWKHECLKLSEKFDMFYSSAKRTEAAIKVAEAELKAGNTGTEVAHQLINASKDVLELSLDSQYKATVTDPAISRKLAEYWESKFFDDMARLRVRDPDTITRVTEYVPEIASFVERIINNGYAYEAEGSVYFNTLAFDRSEGNHYAKLEPWSKGNLALLEDGEGSLGTKAGRRSPADFALWKASKPGEPAWPSPWGMGRPGWHIECSVMASEILGDNMDIHSGGIDLAFPHHDNELAQSEAYHVNGSWVNYFLHTGHLHIEGLKMSKSLKNFITIDEILNKFTARQLRLAFLTQLWNAKVDFSESLMTGEVRILENIFNNFFTNVKALINQANGKSFSSDGSHHYEQPEKDLQEAFYQSQSLFRTALCDSFNTPEAVNVLRDLVSRTNIYINSRGRDLNVRLVETIALWSGKMLRMFGLGEGERSELGWGQVDESGDGANREEILMPYLRTLSSFRDNVRKLAMAKGETSLKDILALCDKLRDNDLVPLGVALDDQEDGQALVKLVAPSELIKAREEKRAQQEAKIAKKAAQVEAERQKRLQKMEKGRVAPQEMFKPPHVPEGTYSSWNDSGIPLTDGEGKELSKNQVKKVQKDFTNQTKLHEEFVAWQKEASQAEVV